MPFGQTIRATSMPVRVPEAEMHRRAGNRLLLRQQAGSNLDVAADAERIDPLIAGASAARADGSPASDSPPCRAPASGPGARPDRPTRSRRPSLFRSSDAEHVAIRRGRQRPKLARSLASQMRERPPPGSHEIERTVVVQIGEEQPMTFPAAPPRAQSDQVANGCSSQRFAIRGTPAGSTRRIERHDIEHAVGVDVADRQRHHARGRRRGLGIARNSPACRFSNSVQVAPRIEQRRVRIAVAIEVAPREAAQARRRRQTAAAYATCRRRCFAARSARRRSTPTTTSRSPSISRSAVHAPKQSAVIAPPRPAALSVASANVPSSACVSSRMPPRAGEREVHPEVVIPVEDRNAAGCRNRHRSRCAANRSQLAAGGGEHNGRVGSVR